MSRQRERQVLAAYAIAIIGDADQLDAAAGEVDVDLARSGIEAVLEDLFERRGGTVDHFAGGDLVDQLIG